MAIYTGVADANGDFNIPFSTNYTGGQKVTVTAEKDAATKSIELYAPSDVVGGGVIQFSGNTLNFPINIHDVAITGLTGVIQASAFEATVDATNLWMAATGLTIKSDATEIASRAFHGWKNSKHLNIETNAITTIGVRAFYNWNALLSCVMPNSIKIFRQGSCERWLAATYVEVGDSVTTMESAAFASLTSCLEFVCNTAVPPVITNTTFNNLNPSCVIKVPAASVTAYQSANNWSAFAARIQAI